jgi:hypothetical protein
MTIQRWDHLNVAQCELHDAIKKAKTKTHGPALMSHRDAKKMADEFSSLMLLYGFPEFAHPAAVPKKRKVA